VQIKLIVDLVLNSFECRNRAIPDLRMIQVKADKLQHSLWGFRAADYFFGQFGQLGSPPGQRGPVFAGTRL
jgi:hypothetical protein